MDTTFARVIEDHLDLKRRNADLDADMPLSRYRVEDPFENHPLFKTEEQALVEDTLGGTDPHLNADTMLAQSTTLSDFHGEPPAPDDSFWTRSRDFDWGD